MAAFFWRAWIGPRFTPSGSTRMFNWTGINAGSAFSPASDKSVTTQVNSGASSVVLNSVSGLAAKGGGFLGPNGSGQSWEYVEYESISTLTLTNVAREDTATREHNGVHAVGAVFRQWWPITSNDGRIHLTKKMNEEFSALTWEMELSGVNIPRFALKNEHIIVIERRVDAGSWVVHAVGWLSNPELTDDSKRHGEWKVTVRSLAGVLGNTMLRGLRVGPLDVAKVASAKTNSQLAMAWKERQSNDFIESDPSFDPENVLDADEGTLWISERVLGSDYVEVNNSTLGYLQGGNFATQLHLRNPPNGEKGYRWIEWIGEPTSGNDIFFDGYMTTSKGHVFLVQFNNTHTVFPERHIICEDKDRFLEANPLGGETESIFEVPSWWWDSLDLANDAIAIYYIHPSAANYWSKTIAWGSSGLTADKTPWFSYEGDYTAATMWPGTQVTLPALPGRMIRFQYNAGAPSPLTQPIQHYVWGQIDHAGYRIQGMELEEAERPWVLLRLPGLGLTLRDDITSSVPGGGANLYIVDGGGAATGGLPSSGTIAIGDERISYSSKTTEYVVVTARGVSSTTAAAHRAGDIIEVVDTDGVATDGLPVKSIGWSRSGGTSYPYHFKVARSNREAVREPDKEDDSWETDFEELADVTAYVGGATWSTGTLSPTRRVRHLLVEIYGMSGNPSRARINEIQAILDNALYPSSEWLDLPCDWEDVLERLLLNAGVPAGAIDLSGISSVTLARPMNTAFDSAWRVIEDAASYLGLRVEVGMDSKVRVVQNQFWRQASHSTAHTWTRANAARVEVFSERSRPNSQIALVWEELDDAASQGTARYPSNAYWMGDVSEIGPYLHLSQSEAGNSVERRFWMARFPYRFLVQAANGDHAASPGRIEEVSWQMGAEAVAMTRQCVAVSVDNVLEQGVWTTIYGLRQITRDPFDA